MDTSARTSTSFLSSAALHEYLLVAHPTAEVKRFVVAEKQFFYDKYKERIAVKMQPHITVAGFLATEQMEETITRYIQRVCSQHYSFEVELNNYSGFPEHTIYLRVQNQQPFKMLAKELNAVNHYITSCACPALRLLKPHLSFAERLTEAVYKKALLDYSQRTFYARFEVDELVLIRKSADSFRMVHLFPFQPKPQQGSLFKLKN